MIGATALSGGTMRTVQSTPPLRGTVLTVLNMKGGVGKTHTSWLLSSVCEERNLRILAIDTDPQGNLSNSFARDRGNAAGVERLLDPSADADPLPLIRRTVFPHIDILPASSLLSRYDLSDQQAWEKADLHRSFVDPLAELRPLYDFIVFDCPPRLSLVSFAALVASDFVIVPLEAADWGAQGILQVTAAVEYVQSRFNRHLELLGYLVSRYKPRRTYQQSYLQKLRQHFGEQTFDTVIPDLAAFERAVTDCVPITQHSPRSSAARIARGFFDEVTARIAYSRDNRSGSRRTDVRDARPLAV
jgi:chromosome partitioning protein